MFFRRGTQIRSLLLPSHLPLHLFTWIRFGSLYPRKETSISDLIPGKETLTAVSSRPHG
uniref:Uncharacterized protein n=1 Tax=Lepeophtheirus salmonis TaxID=72036 RepID=A0A0K2T178_LEPSM